MHRFPLAAALDTGLRWLYETEQPTDAWMSHHGHQIPVTNNRRLTFAPSGADQLPVVVIHVAQPLWRRHPEGDMCPANPLAPDELLRLTAAVKQHGVPVRMTWNGFPAHSGSIGLARPAHPTQYAAVERYRAGCQEHPMCSVFCDCDSWRAGFRRAIYPSALIPA